MDQSVLVSVLHLIVQIIVTQAVLHLQLIKASENLQQRNMVGSQLVAFNDQLKPEFGSCLLRFRRFLSTISSGSVAQSDVDELTSLATVYEQVLSD